MEDLRRAMDQYRDQDAGSSSYWWSSSSGDGPTLSGYALSILKTSAFKFGDAFRRFFDSPNPADEKILKSRGEQITSSILIRYLESLKTEIPNGFEFSTQLCLSTINSFSLQELRSHFEDLKRYCNHKNLDKVSWAIPMIYSTGAAWELNHIIIAVVRCNEILFMDSKGRTSDKYKVTHEDGDYTVTDVLKCCAETFRSGLKVRFIENKNTCQWDINNCGVFVSHFVFHSLVLKHSIETFLHQMEQVSDTLILRQQMWERIKPDEIPNPVTPLSKSAELPPPSPPETGEEGDDFSFSE